MGNSGQSCSKGPADTRCCGEGQVVEEKPRSGWDAQVVPAESEEPISLQSLKANDQAGEHRYVAYSDGSTYTGQIVGDQRHGSGLWQAPTWQYEGQWQANAQHGEGRQTWTDGRVYEGEFRGGKFHGVGKMTWNTPNGPQSYEGEYKDDHKHGAGKFVWPDGRFYDGQWENGKRHGRGVHGSKNDESRAGYWVDDKFSRWEQA